MGGHVDEDRLRLRLREFATARDWHQFHSPKNLAMALSVEAGELMELFQWLSEEESRQIVSSNEQLRRAREELADVQIYLLRLADVLGIDLTQAVLEKIEVNEEKYPINKAFGSAKKYTDSPS